MQDSNIIGYIRKNKKHILRFNLIHICFWSWVLMHLYIFGLIDFNNTKNKETKEDNYKETLTVGTMNMPPLSFQGKDGTIGSDMAFCKELAKELGYKLDIKVYDGVEGLTTALNKKQVDFIIGSMNNTEKRQKNFDVINYLKATASILIKKNNEKLFKQFQIQEEGKDKGKISFKNKDISLAENNKINLIVQQGGIFVYTIENDYFINDYKKYFKYKLDGDKPKVDNTESSDVCVLNVKKGISTGFITDTPIAKGIAENDSDQLVAMEFVDNEFTESQERPHFPPFGFFIKKGDPNPKVSKEEFEEKVKAVLKSDKLDEQSNNYRTNYLSPAIIEYKEIQQELKGQTFWSKIIITLPSYIRPFISSFIVALDSLILGFGITLLCVKVKIFAKQSTKKNNDTITFYFYKSCSRLIDELISVLNAIPIAVQALLFYFALSNFDIFKNNNYTPFITTLIVISLNTIASITTLMMHNIETLDKGQIEAAYSLGMNQKQVFKYILFEQGLQLTKPFIWQQFIFNIKDTALFSLITFVSLIKQAKDNASIDYDTLTPYFIVSVVYLILVKSIQFISKKTNKIK
ncbi:transporter substrate-binding domain-containing protein [Candidatus Phytoplasma asteris]|uniref:ABC-type amino acid transport system, permease component n=2 Tax=16SrI (Aster yellows group) TaxID=3042590 RepID=A0A859IBW8_9MOLU|nr:MAG: ABC-type amino acid transport system, permease component [Rapeseed phyllody phytoplasma]